MFVPLPRRYRLAVLACGLVLFGCADESPQPPFDLTLPVEQSVLENGLELIVVPNHTAPLVTALVAFRVGSFVEDAEVNGYSHLFEHMMFQGSRAVPDSQDYRDQLGALGAADNAYTSVDEVAYHLSVPSASLEGALELMSGALREPELDAVRLDKERQVVLSEIDLNESDPTFAARRMVNEALFGAYAVRLDPLGSREVVSSVSRDELLAMHQRYYVPNNALLVLSGDVTPAQGRALAERYFGDWEKSDEVDVEAAPVEPTFDHSQFQIVRADVSRTYIDLRLRGPSHTDDPEGALAGELLAAVTLLPEHHFRSLVRPEGALSALFLVRSLRHTGYIQVQLSVPFGNERAVLEQLGRTLDDLAGGKLMNELLETAREQTFRNYLRSTTRPGEVPFALAREFGADRALDYFEHVDRVYAFDHSSLQRFVQRYVRGRPRAVVLTSSPDNIERQGLTRDWLRLESGL